VFRGFMRIMLVHKFCLPKGFKDAGKFTKCFSCRFTRLGIGIFTIAIEQKVTGAALRGRHGESMAAQPAI
jgi:hypothetical protein